MSTPRLLVPLRDSAGMIGKAMVIAEIGLDDVAPVAYLGGFLDALYVAIEDPTLARAILEAAIADHMRDPGDGPQRELVASFRAVVAEGR